MSWCLVDLQPRGASTLLPSGETVTLGRDPECTVTPKGASENFVSHTHCKIYCFAWPEDPEIEDCSTNGTSLLPYQSFLRSESTGRVRLVKGVRTKLHKDAVILLTGLRRFPHGAVAYRLHHISQSSVRVHVLGLSGALCDFESSASGTIADTKKTICCITQIHPLEQRLVFDTHELHDGSVTLSSFLQEGRSSIVFTMMRRPAEQAEWLARVGTDGKVLLQAPPSIQADPEVVAAAVRQDPQSLQYAAHALRNERAFALSMIGERRSAVHFVDDSLKQDRGFVLSVLEQYRDACIPESFRLDDEYILEAVRRNPFTLFHATAHQSNPTIVAAAVTKNGLSLQFASEQLRNDRGIVAAAIHQNKKALKYASEALQADLASKRTTESRRPSRSRSRR